jgi:hypothetical protein
VNAECGILNAELKRGNNREVAMARRKTRRIENKFCAVWGLTNLVEMSLGVRRGGAGVRHGVCQSHFMDNEKPISQFEEFRSKISSMTNEELNALAAVLKRHAREFLEEVRIVEEQLSRKKGKRETGGAGVFAEDLICGNEAIGGMLNAECGVMNGDWE